MSILGRLGFQSSESAIESMRGQRHSVDTGDIGASAPAPSRAYLPAEGEGQYLFHSHLGEFNAKRLAPALPEPRWMDDIQVAGEVLIEEGLFVERERRLIAMQAAAAPPQAGAFAKWLEHLHVGDAGHADALLSWLATRASLSDMRWFLAQEAVGEAAVGDLVAITQVRFPSQAKLEMARIYWDEMGRGHENGIHGPMLSVLFRELGVDGATASTVWESLALSNLMVALAANRRYAYHAVGALGSVALTAPKRFAQINAGLRRLGISTQARMYFQMLADLDIDHSSAWNREVVVPLITANPAASRAIAEGAVMRMSSRARCDRRYQRHFKRSI